jgi:hypothetical protein
MTIGVGERDGMVLVGTAEAHETMTPEQAMAKAPAMISAGNNLVQEGTAIVGEAQAKLLEGQALIDEGRLKASLGDQMIVAARQAQEKAGGK